MVIDIVKAEIGDLAAVRQCAESAYGIYVERIGRKPAPMVADFAAALGNGNLYLAKAAEEVTGFVVFYPRRDHLHLENVAVDPRFQGRGIGARLIGFVEAEARRLALARVELYTNARMTENREMYPAMGYRETARRVEDGFERIYYEKTLAKNRP